MKLFSRKRQRYASVDAARAKQIQDGGAILLDVRDPAEWRAGHAPKARHIPLGELASRSRELPQGRHIVTMCRSGARSARAAALLSEQGWEVSNLAGGARAWVAAGLPFVARGGGPGQLA